MERKKGVLCMIFIMLFTAGCSKQLPDTALEEKKKPVKVVSVKEEVRPITLAYTGVAGAEELKKLAFQSPGKIAKVMVERGQPVQKGQQLAQLDTKDLEYALVAAKGQLEGAQAQYDKVVNGAVPEEIKRVEINVKKARDAYHFADENYKKMLKLYEEGAISKNDLDKAKLELDMREADLHGARETEKQVKNGARAEDQAAARGQLEQARADYSHKKRLLEEATLTADTDGYVVDVLYQEGEMVGAGYPVVVIRNNKQVVNVGLTSKDLGKVQIGMKAKVRMGNTEWEGEVTNIGQMPDSQSRTYSVQIALPENALPMGTVVKVDLIVGEERGIWIPIPSILTDGEDYVFVVKDAKAYKRKIALGEATGAYVKVQGLQDGEALVIEGMKKLEDKDQVSVQR